MEGAPNCVVKLKRFSTVHFSSKCNNLHVNMLRKFWDILDWFYELVKLIPHNMFLVLFLWYTFCSVIIFWPLKLYIFQFVDETCCHTQIVCSILFLLSLFGWSVITQTDKDVHLRFQKFSAVWFVLRRRDAWASYEHRSLSSVANDHNWQTVFPGHPCSRWMREVNTISYTQINCLLTMGINFLIVRCL